MTERRSRRPLLILTVLVGVGVAVLAVASFFAAERRLRGFCAEVEAGSLWTALEMSAGTRGLKVVPPHDGRPALVTDSAAFGRYVCMIEVGTDGRVGSARFKHND